MSVTTFHIHVELNFAYKYSGISDEELSIIIIVSFPDPTTHAREKGLSRFLVLQTQQSCDYLHMFVLEHVQSCDGAQDQENAPMSPDPFLTCVVGLGTRL